MVDSKPSNAVVALVAFYSGREAEYDAELRQKDALLLKAVGQSEEQRKRADEAHVAYLALTRVAAEAQDVLLYAREAGAEFNAPEFHLTGNAADALRRLFCELEKGGRLRG